MLAVSDTGTGMDTKTLSHMFEPFFTTKESDKGTGLGLATVYGIVKQSGGNIWVYSEPGRGTTFKIYLPRVEEMATLHQLVKPAPSARPRGSETVLLVEDEDGVRSLVWGILKAGGYNILEASRPADALITCQDYGAPIHLLLTDVVMPQMSGRELAERLKLLHPETKVLYMSGYTAGAIIHHGVLEPDTPFVQKPFTPDSVARKVREVLDAQQNEPSEGQHPRHHA
jgi:CheY-like chemotaxis protein